jgi:hypothetical protein
MKSSLQNSVLSLFIFGSFACAVDPRGPIWSTDTELLVAARARDGFAPRSTPPSDCGGAEHYSLQSQSRELTYQRCVATNTGYDLVTRGPITLQPNEVARVRERVNAMVPAKTASCLQDVPDVALRVSSPSGASTYRTADTFCDPTRGQATDGLEAVFDTFRSLVSASERP